MYSLSYLSMRFELVLISSMVSTGGSFLMNRSRSLLALFTFTMIALIAGFAFLKGPRSYIKNLFVDKNLYASITLISSIILSLLASLVWKSYIWSLLFCIIELNAVLYFFCNAGISLTQVRWFCSAACNAAKSRFK